MSLQDRAMIVTLTCSQFGLTKKDKTASRKTAELFSADEKRVSFSKKLITDEGVVKDIRNLIVEVYSYHNSTTLPWMDNGGRILPSDLYFDYTEKIRHFKEQLETKVDELCSIWSDVKYTAQRELGDLYNEQEFPSTWDLRNKYGIRINIAPFPDVKDFRVNLGQVEIDRLKRQYAESVDVSIQTELWGRFRKLVEHYKERMSSEGKLYASVLDHLRDFVQLLPKLNITNDPAIEALAQQVQEELLRYPADIIRDNPYLKEDMAEGADKILDQMQDIFGKVEERAA